MHPDRGYIGHKAAKMMRRSKAIEARRQAAAGKKSKLLGPRNLRKSKITQPAYHAKRLITLRMFRLLRETKACRNVSFTIDRGDRIALCGRNGSGSPAY
jgi:lincosamide and streptogramin A transport system ATP-binding/permease protein